MIKANELRIGNWIIDYEVEPNKTIYYQIEEIKKRAIDKNRLDAVYRNGSVKCSLDWLTPIPLTEELLLKCGFIYHYTNVFYISIKKDTNLDTDTLVYDFIKNKCYLDVDFTFIGLDNEIKYLHQLQNLYFALTGTELEIKL